MVTLSYNPVACLKETNSQTKNSKDSDSVHFLSNDSFLT